eukprot:CAMPEP_0116032890 /NCGR_PEP_ID=MMETSP0321-20121206/18527_1 /TAXON_ID=163516 /ORGANISM="Leptocylindrus danicus var. danicus, Strain B650" /LENGTH=272 /DNA_ID=CAMNT_0003508589 /DNA_START=214 /DNA_END=1032 /DNA_ORIENTATION=+
MGWHKVVQSDQQIIEACSDLDKARILLKKVLSSNGFELISEHRVRIFDTSTGTNNRMVTWCLSDVSFDLKIALCLPGKHRCNLLSVFSLLQNENANEHDMSMIAGAISDFEQACAVAGVDPALNFPMRNSFFLGFVSLSRRRQHEVAFEKRLSANARVFGMENQYEAASSFDSIDSPPSSQYCRLERRVAEEQWMKDEAADNKRFFEVFGRDGASQLLLTSASENLTSPASLSHHYNEQSISYPLTDLSKMDLSCVQFDVYHAQSILTYVRA